MTITQLASGEVGANCEEGGATVPEFEDAFRNLTHVQYNLELGAGLELDLGPANFKTDLVSVPFELATQCLAYQTQGSTTGLALATAVLELMTHTPTSSPTGAAGSGSTSSAWPTAAHSGVYLPAAIMAFGVTSFILTGLF